MLGILFECAAIAILQADCIFAEAEIVIFGDWSRYGDRGIAVPGWCNRRP